MTRLLINIGNSHCSIAKSKDGKIRHVQTLKTDELLEDLDLIKIQLTNYCSIWAASVVSELTEKFDDNFPDLINWIHPDLCSGLKFDHYDKSSLGADRLANAVAAVRNQKLPVMVIDCGTAITTEVVDADKQFCGGIIMPGRAIAYKSLAGSTSLLPFLELSEKRLPVVGKNTNDAIRSGVQHLTIGAIKELILETRKHFSDNLSILITGGDKEFFANALNYPISTETFTFQGIDILADLNE